MAMTKSHQGIARFGDAKEDYWYLRNGRTMLAIATTGTSLFIAVLLLSDMKANRAIALPPPEDTPEEVLRTEIILEARSPLDGESLTASEYLELQSELAESENPPSINSETQQLIFLLRIRKFLNVVLPFQVF